MTYGDRADPMRGGNARWLGARVGMAGRATTLKPSIPEQGAIKKQKAMRTYSLTKRIYNPWRKQRYDRGRASIKARGCSMMTRTYWLQTLRFGTVRYVAVW